MYMYLSMLIRLLVIQSEQIYALHLRQNVWRFADSITVIVSI